MIKQWQQLRLLFTLGLGIFVLLGCGDDVGKVSLGLFTTKDVVIDARQDPKIPGVTCHISRIQADFGFF